MKDEIEAIFLDVGNTLRIVVEDKDFMTQARKDLRTLVGAPESEEDFFKKMDTNWKIYRKQSKETLLEASEKELWTKWLLPDYPADKIGPSGGKINPPLARSRWKARAKAGCYFNNH